MCTTCALSHQKDECDFLRESQLNKNILLANMNIIIAIRCLLVAQREDTRADSEKFFRLEGHVEVRKTRDIWQYVQGQVVEPMISSGVLEKFKDKCVDAETIHKICGIIDVNSFDIRGPRELRGCVPNGFSLRGIYFNAAMLSHHCVSNVLIVVGADYQLKMFASVAIKKGETIFNNYTNLLFVSDVFSKFSPHDTFQVLFFSIYQYRILQIDDNFYAMENISIVIVHDAQTLVNWALISVRSSVNRAVMD